MNKRLEVHTMDVKKLLREVPAKYRPIPFWSWNEKLDTEETKRQIEMMHHAGMGGAFMHARGGLQTEYMGKEWFENVEASLQACKTHGMTAWAYDENGWPSGFGSGAVNGMGEVFWQKYLRIEKGTKQTENTIVNADGYHLYYEVNRFYVDNLDKNVVQAFIEHAYKPYCEKYAGQMPGIFTDEPQLSRNGIPWSFVLPAEYQKEYGEELLPLLPALFYEIGDYKTVRFRFWKLVTHLFQQAFVKQIYEYLDSFGMQLTGHMVLEETLLNQIPSNGAVMPHYRYFHVPGIDWLSRSKIDPLGPLQLSSVAHQMGQKQILTESFALCGHNVSFEELRWLLESQFVRGVNLLCPHLEGYSLRGIRKRDYPPAMYYQQPWWSEYRDFTEQLTRIGILLTEGRAEFDTLLIHPIAKAWTLFDCGENKGIEELNKALLHTIGVLEQKHILFHLGDETLMQDCAYVQDGKLVIGQQRYSRIVMVQDEVLFPSTQRLLEKFQAQGGQIVSLDAIPENAVCDRQELVYACRRFDDFTMHYFVNETETPIQAKIFVGNKYMDLKTGEFMPFDGSWLLAPMSSIVVIEEHGTSNVGDADCNEKPTHYIKPNEIFEVIETEDNALVLDCADYWFDGELMEENAYILDVGDKANQLERPVCVRLRYTFEAAFVPKRLFLVCETPAQYEIAVNGTILSREPVGWFRDKAFCKIDISDVAHAGCNEIVLTCDFQQSDACYQMIKNSRIFESEKNKLCYDMEIEGLFLVGDFEVQTTANDFEKLEKDAVRYHGRFVIVPKESAKSLLNLEQNGYPFFAGRMKLQGSFFAEHTQDRHVLKLSKKGVNAIHVRINDQDAGVLFWNPYEIDVSPFVIQGENKIELTIVNNLRNLMGPHHLEMGECLGVGPGSFYRNGDSPFSYRLPWNAGYCLVETSVEIETE